MTDAAEDGYEGVIRLKGQDVATQTKFVKQSTLQFYADNPRIYSLVRSSGHEPDQSEILDQLLQHEHVKELIQDIKANGGLIDPLIVRDGDMVVLEGNSRLAAYRFLASKDPILWSKVRCTVLPAGIDEQLVFALLGQYHIKGKKDWAPYEKAGFLYRRHKEHKVELPVVAVELGIPIGEAKHLSNVYGFMLANDDQDRAHWSYYDEFLKSAKIRKVREEYSDFDEFIVKQIKSDAIPKAMDLRDMLPVICTGPVKILKRYISDKLSFEEAYESAVDAGSDNYALKRMRKFREWLVLNETEDDLTESNKTIRDKMYFELKEIEKRSHRLKEVLEKKKLA